ncbi:glycoside hydrolase superfamily [Lipomyces kononenkoae]|uniref:Glycoside hydrolase superfamily n=1 Tax=Lipomyces kononenkoae TaxID=34357 RepID=A0ACC3SXU9_LIPKO
MADIDVEYVLSELTLNEKVALLSGVDGWHTAAIPRLGVPAIRFSDGPNGVRGTRFFNGVPSACLPCATALGATFDSELVFSLGRLLGMECKAKGVHVLLGPTINIQRGPLGGRGFESFSEDPVLSGSLATSYCLGLQKEDIVPTLKHLVCNDQEHERVAVSALVTQRALREIYLLPFQIAIAGANPGVIMTSYNKLNGTHTSENPELLQGIVRKEWGYKGLLLSDWFGTYSGTEALNAGLDLEMPGPSRFRGPGLVHAVTSNKVAEFTIDDRVRNVLELVKQAAKSGIRENAPEFKRNLPEDQALLRRAAAESIVLLKNDDAILPLDPTKKTLVLGPNADIAVYCGGGSASLPGYYAVTPLESIRNRSTGEVTFTQGAYGHKELPLLGDRLKTEDGQPGYIFRVYTEPATTKGREAVDTLHMTSTSAFLMDYTHPKVSGDLYYVTMEGTFEPTESGIYDFGLTVAGTGLLFVDGEVVVDNKTKQRQGTSFFGIGTPEERGSKYLEAGRPYRIFVEYGTAPTSNLKLHGVVSFGPGGLRVGACRRIDPDQAIQDAVDLAAKADQVVICVGLSGEWESEGFDRTHMDLPPRSDDLVQAVLAVQPNAVVVVQSGTPVTMPWAGQTKALLQAWYGGNETGNGIADVLFGDVNPSGKLPLSFPKHLKQNPSYLSFRSERGRVLYSEDVYVGYRYYESVGLEPLFSFGYGLSYTSFSLSNLSVSQPLRSLNKIKKETIDVSVTIENVGCSAGAETAQIYVIPPSTSSGRRPERELKGFKKVHLQPGHKQTVLITIPLGLASSFWDEARSAWMSEAGDYTVTVVGTGKGNALSAQFTVAKTRWWTGLLGPNVDNRVNGKAW